MNVLIAYDGSGSTGGCAEYHNETQKIVSQYPDSKILFWDSTHRLISHSALLDINTRRAGFGGTSPEEIAKWITNNDFHGHLVIITDGEVGISNIDRCEKLLSDWTFEYVEAHLIGRSVNMSVTCPFTRTSPHTVYLYEPTNNYSQSMVTHVTAKDMELITEISSISSVEKFNEIAPKLETVLIARTMGTDGNMELRDKLLDMKKRITNSISYEAGRSDSTKEFILSLRTGDYDRAVVHARKLTSEYYCGFDEDVSGTTWSSKISRMISMTEGALRSVFSMNAVTSGIQSDRVRRAGLVSSAPTPTPSASTSHFECPITLDSEHDVVLLVTSGEPILADVDKRIVDDILDCPLNLLKYSELVTKTISRLDHPVSLTAFSANPSGWNSSPITRASVLPGAICFGDAADHVKATQWTLAQLFTGGKLVGNPDFWFATIWWILRHEMCPAYLQGMKPFADTHMMWRLVHQSSYIALSGLPEFPTTRVPLDCAIWYVLASPLFADEFGASRDVLRGHIPHLPQLLELASLAKLDMSDRLQNHYIRLKTMLRYLVWCKTDNDSLRTWTRMLIQNHIYVKSMNTYIPVDGPPSAEQIAEARSKLRADPVLTIDELVGIATLVSPQKSASDIPLVLTWSPESVLCGIVEWGYGLGPQEPLSMYIHPRTCRPKYVFGAETWREQSVRKYGPLERQISINSHFGKYVQIHGVYPSRDELLIYLYKRYVIYGKHTTLPAQIYTFIDEVLSDNASIMETILPTEFCKRWSESVRIEDRIKMENEA